MTRMPLALVTLCLSFAPCATHAKVYPYRWVFVARQMRSDADLERVREIARVAAPMD